MNAQTTNPATLEQRLESFFKHFPDDATCWMNAGDEIRDLARWSREFYNEMELNILNDDSRALQPLDFRAFKTPAEWNSKAKEFIRATVAKMNERTKREFLFYAADRFDAL